MILIPFILLAIGINVCYSNYTVHIVPNSHIDVGWGWTIDQYYRDRVENIYNTIHKELDSNAERTFVICEIIYFEWWYYNQTEPVRSKFKQWSSEGRIEFVGGGMVMNDEALPSFQDIITNYEMGFEFIKKEFNTKPKVGWYLDPFGHSAANTYLMNKLGFEQNVLGRLDIYDKKYRTQTKTVEFMWKPFNNEGIFTHILPYHYDISGSYTFGFEKFDAWKSKTLQTKWAKIIAETIWPFLQGYEHNQFLLIFGHDFSYQRPNITYPVLDLITSLKDFTYNGKGFDFIYSTATRYFTKVKEEFQLSKLPIQTQFDCFPLQDNPQHYWSGYFTSRPYLKGSIRVLSNTYLVSSVLLAELVLKQSKFVSDNRDVLRKIGIMQHHDTITGTSNEWVSNDFIKINKEKLTETNAQMMTILNQQFPDSKIDKICLNNPVIDFNCQEAFNLITKKDDESMVIGVSNPLIEGEVLITIEFSRSSKQYEVYDANDKLIQSDFYCITNTEFTYVSKCFMNFFYLFSRKIDITSFTLKVNTEKQIQALSPLPKSPITIINDKGLIKSLEFNPSSLSYSISMNKQEKDKYNISLLHGVFTGNPNSTCEWNINNTDGMYIFSPCTNKPIILNATLESSFMYKGDISSVIIINFGKTYLIVSFYYHPVFIKIDSLINPIKNTEGINFALIIESDVKNNITLPSTKVQPEFWSDSNGMQMIRRIKHFRHMFPYNDTKTIAGNFYPVTESMSIREKKKSYYFPDQYANLSLEDRMITVFNDRPQSGGVLKEGEMILLVSRNSIKDDNRGIGVGMREEPSASITFKVQHMIMLGRSIYATDKDGLKAKMFMYNFFRNTPVLFTTALKKTIITESFISKIINTSSNVILNFKIESKNKIIIQFYCMYDYYFNSIDNPILSSSQYIGIISFDLPIKKYKMNLAKLNGKEIQFIRSKSGFHRKLKPNDFLVMHLEIL